MKQFTAQQKEIVARKLGYDGPMQGFDEYLASDPALEMRYNSLSGKIAQRMAKGGVVKKYQTGGIVLPENWSTFGASEKINYFNQQGVTPQQLQSAGVSQADIDWMKGQGYTGSAPTSTLTPTTVSMPTTTTTSTQVPTDVATLTPTPDKPVQVGSLTYYATPQTIDLGGSLSDAPKITALPTYTAAQTSTAGTQAAASLAPSAVQTAAVERVAAAAPVTTQVVTAEQAAAAKATPSVTAQVAGLQAEQGKVSEAAQVKAVTKEPTTTAVSGLEAAQGTAAQVTGAPTRVVEAGEMVSGTAVDQARIDALMAQQKAAEGVVTAEMTVQGQLDKLLKDFDAGNPPPWASATMRTAAAMMAARGLSASSMAGQAIIQATLEAATPIAAADAKVYEAMGLQNLSNRQQMAMLIAQQRATFLGQEFDQTFQTRVLNAAKVSDIANKNFDAKTQIALENSRLTNSMNIANLSAKNALVLAEAAAMSQIEMQNLSNMQQAAVENAKSFLAMDMKNLDNRQQTALFKTQQITNAMLQDASLQNAVNITNATNALDAAKISAQLALQAQEFNAAEANKVALANAAASNQAAQFNAQQKNVRDQFNAEMATQVNMANAKILAEVSIANTAATNAANAVNAKNATDLTVTQYSQVSQTYRDMLEMSWKTGESEKDRITEIAKATITANATTNAAATTANAANAAKLGGAAVEVIKNWSSVKAVASDIFKAVSSSSSNSTMSAADQAYYAG